MATSVTLSVTNSGTSYTAACSGATDNAGNQAAPASVRLLAGGAIAEAEMHSWVLFAWSVAGYTVGCGAPMWVNQRRWVSR